MASGIGVTWSEFTRAKEMSDEYQRLFNRGLTRNLAADYVRTFINVTTMEGANDAARQAVNALLDTAGSDEARCPRWPLYRAPEFEPWKRLDQERWRNGAPNLFDADQWRR